MWPTRALMVLIWATIYQTRAETVSVSTLFPSLDVQQAPLNHLMLKPLYTLWTATTSKPNHNLIPCHVTLPQSIKRGVDSTAQHRSALLLALQQRLERFVLARHHSIIEQRSNFFFSVFGRSFMNLWIYDTKHTKQRATVRKALLSNCMQKSFIILPFYTIRRYWDFQAYCLAYFSIYDSFARSIRGSCSDNKHTVCRRD
jgi:hypothetical protein